MKEVVVLFYVLVITLMMDISYGQSLCIYISPRGNDTTGNGTPQNPFQSINRGLNYSYGIGNYSHVSLCFGEGNYTNTSVNVDIRKLQSLTFVALQKGSVKFSDITVVPGNKSYTNFTLAFQQVILEHHVIGHSPDNETVFENVIFDSVEFGNPDDNMANWQVFAKYIQLVNCRADNITTGRIYLHAETVNITNLTFQNVILEDIGFEILTSKLIIHNSQVLYTSSSQSLFQVNTSNPSSMVSVSISSTTFANNSIYDPAFFYITDLSSVSVISSTFICNTYQNIDTGSIQVIPFFFTNSNMTYVNNISTPDCSIECPDSTQAINPGKSIFPCINCGPGNGSNVNFVCEPCSPGSFSTHGVCQQCPLYSSQPASGQIHCNCFSNSYVDDSNDYRCNYEVWGIIVAGVYVVVFAAIVYFRRPKSFNQAYSRIGDN
jgi:hypothetical protein